MAVAINKAFKDFEQQMNEVYSTDLKSAQERITKRKLTVCGPGYWIITARLKISVTTARTEN